MSKINVDEIQVGDIVEMLYDNTKWLCYVTDIDKAKSRVYGIWSDNFKEDWDYVSKLTGHWKVINFDELPESPYTEEEAKVDELKVYTGKETIEALLEGKVLEINGAWYRLKDNLEVNINNGEGWETSTAPFKNITDGKFTEVVTPQVGDWVRVNSLGKYICIAQVTRLEGNKMWADWENEGKQDTYYRVDSKGITWQILSPEEVSEYKREQAFVKVGRKLNEFKADDIVLIDSTTEVAVVVSHMNKDAVQLHVFNEAGKGYRGKPHKLTPICFAENQVDLS
ncbi:hypothetical protein [Bacillus cereus]|uniref:hypothetical protein n=1 Tax=Bacillus cereus TaxID=1396 RepID=UPI000BF2C364|nr:hypothetical protein [Bacillus cereus]PEZ62991.1 hypothetical protein CN370_08050 [Bacillus cereus]